MPPGKKVGYNTARNNTKKRRGKNMEIVYASTNESYAVITAVHGGCRFSVRTLDDEIRHASPTNK